MTNRKRRTWSLAALLAASTIRPSVAHALFGLGKKSSDAPSQPSVPSSSASPSAPSGTPQSALPGMSGNDAPNNTVSFQVPSATGTVQSPESGAVPPAALPGTSGTSLPSEVVIKGSESGGTKIHAAKPSLNIETDSFESIRASLMPDESLLLAESPFTVSWRRTYPEFLHNERVVAPWHTTFSERPGIVFRIQDQLSEAMQHPVDPKEARGYQWSLTIADEQGRVFQHYEASKNPPEELVWSGQNDQGEWIRAGRSYSAVYMFTDPGGSPHTKVGKPIQFTGIIHQEPDGLHISLDSSVLFGSTKGNRDIQKDGKGLLRSAADLVKRRYTGIPLRVQVLASTKELADAQAAVVQDYLLRELMLLPQHVTTESAHAQYSDQRVEIVLLNR